MKIIICDNIECRKHLEESEVNSITIQHGESKKEYVLCEECFSKFKSHMQSFKEIDIFKDKTADTEKIEKPKKKPARATKPRSTKSTKTVKDTVIEE